MTLPDGAYTAEQAREFASRWLPAWTGNDPDLLLSFYAPDAFYADPAIPDGACGAEQIRAYFRRLLARYPDWVWTQEKATPMEGGFLNHWHATIPTGDRTVECRGVCTVRMRDGLIIHNEVFFDRTPLLPTG